MNGSLRFSSKRSERLPPSIFDFPKHVALAELPCLSPPGKTLLRAWSKVHGNQQLRTVVTFDIEPGRVSGSELLRMGRLGSDVTCDSFTGRQPRLRQVKYVLLQIVSNPLQTSHIRDSIHHQQNWWKVLLVWAGLLSFRALEYTAAQATH